MAAFRRPGYRPSRALGSVVLLAAACSGHTPSTHTPSNGGFPGGSASVDWGDLRFQVALLAAPADRIRAEGTVTNTGVRPVSGLVPRCLAWLRIYRDETLIWDRQRSREDCGDMNRQVNLAPGETETEWFGAPATEVLGARHPSGLYTVRAYLPRNDRIWEPPRAEMEFTVGYLRLDRPTDPNGSPGDDTLAFPGLRWHMSAADVEAVLGQWGFRRAGERADGAVFYHGASMLGHNAGLVVQAGRGELLKVVGLMEPEPGVPLSRQLQALVAKLTGHYGRPDRTEGRPEVPESYRAHWHRPGTSEAGYALRLAVETEREAHDLVFRLDSESPGWHGTVGRP